MNTAPFDYAVLNDSVAAELESLRAEKQILEANIRTIGQRLSEISLREEKLARLSESLTDLLTTYPPDKTLQDTLPSPSEREKQFAAKIPETSQPAESALFLVTETGVEQRGSAPISASEPESDTESAFPKSESGNQAPSIAAEMPREFNREEFFALYPHLKGGQQPIHILAEKLLEYLGRPTKLRDLTEHILKLGYRHHSQNFTNTVHTVLKNKRDRNNSFYFDPKQRMWELGHWRDSPDAEATTTNKTLKLDSEIVENRANRQRLEPAQSELVETGEIQFLSEKKAKQSKIKVIKASNRNG